TVGRAQALVGFLGLAVFSLLAALAFLVSRIPSWLDVLPALALPLALAGVPGLAGGLLIRRQLVEDDAATRTTGTAVVLTGLTLMLSGLAVAWPLPIPLLLVAIINAL